MQRYTFSVFLLLVLSSTGFSQEKRFVFSQPKMGSPFNIILYHTDSTYANSQAKACFTLVDSFVNIFSDYIDTSELSRLSSSAGKNEFVGLSPALFDIINISAKAWKKSKGSFDITVGPVVKLWRQARKEKHFPEATAIEKRKASTGFEHIVLDKKRKKAKLKLPGMVLDLGGIAQGYIAQKVLDRLKEKGIPIALVDVSGDIAMGTAPPGKKGWTIGINLPEKTDELQNKKLLIHQLAVSTSGDVYQYMVHEGKKYSHIVDPRTGYGVTSQRNVTVIAKDATTADWLATACSILPLRKAKRLARKMDAELLIATIEDEKLVTYSTKGFKNYSF